MKKFFIVCLLPILISGLIWADDMQKPVNNKGYIPIEAPKHLKVATKNLSDGNFDVPEWEFVQEPTTIAGFTNYYDYMPGSYCGRPIMTQPDAYGGVYFVFHGRASTTVNRRLYWAYVHPSGAIEYATITTSDTWQGYPGLAMHPASGDPIATWHDIMGAVTTEDTNTRASFDDFGLLWIPGFWKTPVTFDQPDPYVDEYIWPYMYTGMAPDYATTGNYRVYQISQQNPDGVIEHDILRWIDVPQDTYVYGDLDVMLDKNNWSAPVNISRDWSDPATGLSCRPYPSFAVDPFNAGHVAIFGYAGYTSGLIGLEVVPQGYYVWDSYDGGETWDYANFHSYQTDVGMLNEYVLYAVENVPGFTVDDVILDELHVWIGWPGNQHSTHKTASFDSEGNIHMPQMLWICYVDDVAGSASYWPYYEFQYQAEIVYKTDGTWEIREVPKLPGVDAFSGHTVPWEIEPVSGDTLIYPWRDYPFSIGADVGFHENLQCNAVNFENPWMVQIWNSGTKTLYAENAIPGYDAYATHPILHVSATNNNGENWSLPIELSDIYSTAFPGFADMITMYPYVNPTIKDLGDGWGQIDIYFFDDNDYGSSIQGMGPVTGGEMVYCSFKINFGFSGVFANFSADPLYGFSPLTVQFTDQSYGNATSWEWDFDNDGTIDSYAQNPQWIYTDPGIYTVSLTVSDGTLKATDTETKLDYIIVTEDGNYSLYFDGMNDDVDIYLNNGTSFLQNTPGTIAFWFKLYDFSDDNTPLLVSHEYPEDNFFQFKKIYDNQKMAFHVRDDTHGIEETLYSLNQIENDVWKFTTATVDQNCIKFYINGVLQDSITNTNNYDFINSSNRILFAHSYRILGGSFTNTNLDEVSLWSRALSQQEINFYMNNPPQGNENDIVGCWNLNEGVGDIAYDSTIYGNNGVVNGATWSIDVPPVQHELLSLPTDAEGAPGSSVSIPLTFNNADSIGIEGIEATISFDETILGFMSATLSGGVLENENYGIQANAISDSVITIWIYANGDLFNGEGVIAFIEFNVDTNANYGQTTVLEFTQSELNENPINADNGLFTVSMGASLSLPTDISASNGDSVSIPLTLENPYSIGLEGIEAIISFDETILNSIGATLTGGVLENQNYGIQVNIVGDTLLTIWIYANGALFTGDGIISFLKFEVDPNAINGQTSDLNFTFAEVNEYPVDTTNGLFTVVGIYDIFGNIVYFSNDNPIEHCLVNFDNSKYQAFTDPDGDYEFLEIPYGNYISFASKGDDLGGLSSMDASRIARYGVGLYSLTDYEIIAADVSLNATVSPLDASRVARYGVGLIDELNDDNIHWVFVADSVDSSSWPPIYYETFKYYTPLNTDMTNEDFVGVRLGDVTGNWAPSKKKLITGTKDISATLPEVTGAPTDTVTVTLDVFGLENLEGMDITITFNEQVIDALGATLNGGILENENFGYQVNTNNDNEIILWIYALGDPFSGGGTVALIDFEVVGVLGDSTDIAFTQFDVNEIDFLTNTEDGSLVVTSYGINEIDIPKEIFLGQNYPNPIKGSTEIYFGLTKRSDVDISIFNLKGQLVEKVIQDSFDPGYHSVNYSVENLPNGIYFYKMSVDGVDKEIKKMIILK